jgi:hypothetical protein
MAKNILFICSITIAERGDDLAVAEVQAGEELEHFDMITGRGAGVAD